jgi:hypothetical protein
VAAIKVMIEQSRPTDAVEGNVGNDIVRFRSLLLPRVKAEPKTIPISLKTRGYSQMSWLRWNP